MKKIVIISLLILAYGCSKYKKMENIIDNLYKTAENNNMILSSLLSYDKETPHDLLKLNIAQTYSDLNNLKESDIYFNLIDKNSLKKFNKEDLVKYHLLSISKSYRSKNYQSTYEELEKLKELSDNDELQLFSAEINYLLKKNNAQKLYNDIWKKNPEIFDNYHHKNYLELLTSQKGNEDQILKVTSYIEDNNGYITGLGLIQSNIYEVKEKYSLSLISIYKELNFGFFYGRITKEEILENLLTLERDFISTLNNEVRKELLTLVEGLKKYTIGDFNEALSILSKLDIDNYYYRYLISTILIETDNTSELDGNMFLINERRFLRHPGYYYYLTRLLKENNNLYNFNNVKELYEKIILLSPNSEIKKYSKVQLIELLDLNCDVSSFFLPDEILIEIKDSLELYNSSYIKNLDTALSIQSNYYSDKLLAKLHSLTKDSQFNSSIKDNKDRLSNRTLDKLRNHGIIN